MNINCKSYADLEKEAQAVDGFKFDFRTPTYLASLNSNFHWMFPDAVKVFSSLMRCWNMFSDERRFSKEEYMAYKGWLSQNVGVSRYELHTRRVVMRNKQTAGFAGWVWYEMVDLEGEWNKITCMLAKFAEFAGIGGNRTGGFGLVKVL